MCNGEEWFSVSEGVTVVTDMDGNIISVSGMEAEPKDINITINRTQSSATIKPNGIYMVENGRLKFKEQIAYDII